MRIVILGPTGGGKTTQAKLVAEKYNVVFVDPTILIKEHIGNNGKHADAIRGRKLIHKDINDDILIEIIINRLNELDVQENGYVLSGFPVKKSHLDAMKNANLMPTIPIFLILDDDTCHERLESLRFDNKTGITYSLLTDKDLINNKDLHEFEENR